MWIKLCTSIVLCTSSTLYFIRAILTNRYRLRPTPMLLSVLKWICQYRSLTLKHQSSCQQTLKVQRCPDHPPQPLTNQTRKLVTKYHWKYKMLGNPLLTQIIKDGWPFRYIARLLMHVQHFNRYTGTRQIQHSHWYTGCWLSYNGDTIRSANICKLLPIKLYPDPCIRFSCVWVWQERGEQQNKGAASKVSCLTLMSVKLCGLPFVALCW